MVSGNAPCQVGHLGQSVLLSRHRCFRLSRHALLLHWCRVVSGRQHRHGPTYLLAVDIFLLSSMQSLLCHSVTRQSYLAVNAPEDSAICPVATPIQRFLSVSNKYISTFPILLSTLVSRLLISSHHPGQAWRLSKDQRELCGLRSFAICHFASKR